MLQAATAALKINQRLTIIQTNFCNKFRIKNKHRPNLVVISGMCNLEGVMTDT